MKLILENQSVPQSVGNNMVINNLDVLPDTSMFVRLPIKSFIYNDLADKGFYLIRAGANSLTFRGQTIVPSDIGKPHPEFKIRYDLRNDDASTEFGIYRQICTNGMIGFDSMQSFSFDNVSRNKIDRHQFMNVLDTNVSILENTILKYTNKSINQENKIKLLDKFVHNISTKTSKSHYQSYHNMKKDEIDALITAVTDEKLLIPNRSEDMDNTYWLAFNTIQENMTNVLSPILNQRTLAFENKLLTKSLEQIFA